jgi:hypothetical protein
VTTQPQGPTHKNTTKIFVSFEYNADLQNARNFVAQAKSRGYAHPILDLSLTEHRPESQWKSEATRAIRGCDVFVVLLGQNTHNAWGVKWEVDEAHKANKRIVQVRPQGKKWNPLIAERPMVTWRWKRLDREINGVRRS